VSRIEIATAGGPTPYVLRAGCLGELGEALRGILGTGRCFLVTDSNVGPLYGGRVAGQLAAETLELPAGEEHKRWSGVERVVRWLLAGGVERGDVVVALGGGVITDLVGFAASVTLRGLAWVAIPTSLLGMVDAAVGGKTGIDLEEGKNLVGTFWPPRAIVADPAVLVTLDPRQLRAGLAEVVKSAMIAPSTLEHTLVHHLDAVARGDVSRAADLIHGTVRVKAEVVKSAMIAPSTLEHTLVHHLDAVARGDVSRAADLIHGTVRVKAEVVALDERESGPRASLNLGHTLAHALEGATGYRRFLHGEAVAWGLLAVLRIARDRGLLSTADATTWAGRLEALAPLPAVSDLAWEELEGFAVRDKKRAGGRVGWVLPRDGGVVVGCEVEEEEIRPVWEALRALLPEGPFSPLF
jgi:3-dehydroquinate synthetase